MKLEGPRVTIRRMVADDVDAMLAWRPFVDPLYQPFDFPRTSRSDQLRWFEWRSQDPARRLYTVLDEHGQVIGSLTLREIDGHRSARLGITIGADYVSQGYGTEAMSVFFDHYFDVMGFREMVLDVAATNVRAVRAYRSLGFHQTSRHYRAASHSSYHVLRTDPHYQHLRHFFRRRGTGYEVVFYDMALSREEWQEKRELHIVTQSYTEIHRE
jgi:RimJ/RimL family protein N-acetyltransferase